MKFVLNCLKQYKVQAILAPLFKMLEAIFELLVPLVVASIIDKGIGSLDVAYVIKMSGVLFLLAIVGLFIAITAQYFSAKAAVYTAAAIRGELFKKILSFSAKKREEIGEEVLITRITNDINQIQNGINMFLRLFLRSPFIVFGAMIMAFTIDVKSALVFVLVIAVLGFIVFLIMRYTLPGYRVVQKNLENVLLATSENISGVRVIRAFDRTEKEVEGFENKTAKLKESQLKVGRIAGLLNPITYVGINFGIILLVYVSAKQVDGNVILQGSVAALVNYMSQILVELIKLANLIVLLMKAFPSAERVQEIMELDSDERKQVMCDDEIHNADITFKNVSFSYNDSEEMDVSDVSFTIKEGDFVGILGGTGSGKTAILRLMNHSFEPQKGEIFIGKRQVSDYSDKALSEIFGIVSQKVSLFAGTIRSNLSMGKSYSDDELIEALKLAQAYDFVMEKPGKLDAKVSQRGLNFSGGQRQRLSIARAILRRPRILLLDDSASALDLTTEKKIKNALQELSYHPTIIMISQRASSVKDAKTIFVLEDGKLVDEGNHDKLIASCEIYREIYYAQYPDKEAE